jgi:orotate phosphoribosyltransferase
MTTERLDVLGELDRAGAILLDRHFVYKSGKHGSGYINMDPLFADVRLVSMICAELVRPFRDEFDTVAGPAMGGTILAFASACQVTDREVSAVWADKTANGFAFERAGFVARLAGKRVLIVEDLLTTGGSVVSVCDEVRRHGGRLIGVSTICNRGGLTAAQLGVPRLEALASVSFEGVDPDACSLCAVGIPIVEDIGHGAEYKARNPDYKGGYTTVL